MSDYLDLLKKCLTGYLYPESSCFFLAPPERVGLSPYRATKWAVVRLADLLGYRIQKYVPFDPLARAHGRDWPHLALTMIGLKRLDNLHECIVAVLHNKVPGDLIETGAWRGGSTIFMRAALQVYGDTERRVWVADSFEGMPMPKMKEDRESPNLSGDRYLAASLPEVRENFARFGLLDERVRFLKGWFHETLPNAPIEKLAILRLDGDLYESTIVALRALYPKVQPGGFVIVDDYGNWPGCKAAVDDYRREHGIRDEIQDIDGFGVYWQVGSS